MAGWLSHFLQPTFFVSTVTYSPFTPQLSDFVHTTIQYRRPTSNVNIFNIAAMSLNGFIEVVSYYPREPQDCP